MSSLEIDSFSKRYPAHWRWPAGAARWVSPLVLLILWEVASRVDLIPARVLAAPTAVLAAGADLAASGELWRHLAVSLARAGAGLAIGVAIGVVLALGAGLSRVGETAIDPLLQIKRTLPLVALTPLLIVWFGIGETPKLVLIAAATIFPVYLSLFSAIRGVDVKLIEAARAFGLPPIETVTQVVLPAALPGLFAGLRYASAAALLFLVVAEQVNASAGLGYLINNARDFLRTDIIVLCLAIYAGLGLVTDGALRAVERRVLAWRPSLLEAAR